jgi:hypothetical protein
MPKDTGMKHPAIQAHPPATNLLPAAPWSLRAWPTLLWQAGEPSRVTFRHLGTRVMSGRQAPGTATGQTMWAGSGTDGEAGMAWDWVQLCRGVVAMADPMAVVTNVRLVGSEGAVLSLQESARFLNEIVHALPWQLEVHKALGSRVN